MIATHTFPNFNFFLSEVKTVSRKPAPHYSNQRNSRSDLNLPVRIGFIFHKVVISGGSRGAATSKMERFVIIVNGFQPLTIITKRSIFIIAKRSILDVAAALDPPLVIKCLIEQIFEKQKW